MENNFVILLNDLPIECNEKFIKSNFIDLYVSRAPQTAFLLNANQRSIQIDGGNDFYEVTKDIFQGNNYEITNDNFNYLDELSKKISSTEIRTKLNTFLYNCECNNHQIDQHPSIQFLVELSTLIHKLSLSNYEDISSQIKQKLIPQNTNNKSTKEKGKKSKRKKGKKNQKRKQESTEEEENNEENEKLICLKGISKKTLSKLFYYEIVNCLSSNFHTAEELQDHQNKIDLIIQLIKELDSNDEEEEEESNTYLANFIKYVTERYTKVKNSSCTISNHLQETFYLINYLISNKLLTLENLHNGNKKTSTNLHKFLFPDYFLHFYPQDMIDKYFRNHNELLTQENNKLKETNSKTRKGKKGDQQKYDSNKDQVQEYLQNHQEKIKKGFSFDDDFLNIIINDNLDEFKSYIRKKVDDELRKNKKDKKKGKIDENMIINEYIIPNEISKFSCISALNNSSIIELCAFFGSRTIFKYLNEKKGIKKSSKFLEYLIVGQDSQVIKFYLESLTFKKKNNEADGKEEEDNEEIYEDSEDNEYSNINRFSSFGFFNKINNKEVNQELDDGYIIEKKDAFNTFNDFYYENSLKKGKTEVDKAKLNKEFVIKQIKKMMLLCIEFGNFDLFIFLRDYILQFKEQKINCNPNYTNLDQYMKRCVSRGYFDIIPELLKEGATADTLLNLFSKANNEIGIEYMLDFSYINVNNIYNNKTPLEYCIDNKNEHASILLLKTDKIDCSLIKNKDNETYIQLACKFGLSKVAEYLLQKNLLDINEKTSEGIRPIHLACQSGNFDTVQIIIQEKKKAIKINGRVTKGEYKGFTPLHFACLSGNPEIVSLLLENYKIDVNIKDGTKKWTSLQYAVFNGHTDVVSILLEQPGIETDVLTKENETLLHLACMSNNKDVVECLINNSDIPKKFDLNERTSNGRTPLQIALSHGNAAMISILLNIDNKKKKKGNKEQSDIDPNLLTDKGQAPLILACEMRRVDIFDLLIKHKDINVNIQLSTGKTALYAACELNIIEIVKELLSWKEIDVNKATKIGKTPLIVACEKGNKEIVEMLIDYNNGKSNKKGRKSSINLVDFNAKTTDGKSALLIACEYLRMNIAEMLVDIDEIECDDASDDGKTPLCYACEKGSEYLSNELIIHGADVNHHTKDNRTPLYFACLSRNGKIIQNILSKIDDKSQINLKETTNGTSPLFIACQNGDLDSFNLLINEINDADMDYIDNNERSLLFAACEGENSEIVEILLTKFNVNSNIANNEGKTPLHIACEKKNTETVFLILNHSSNEVNLNDKWNNSTPLEIACEKGSIEIVKLLLKQEGIQVNPSDKNEVPPLLCACEIWRTDIIKLLLNEVPDIDVDAAHSDGRTVLHYACEKGDVEICEIILSKSADSISKRTTDKKTPIELACQNENTEIISLLLKHVSDIQINAKFFDGNTILTKACIQQSIDVVKLLLESTIIDINAANKNDKTALFIVAKNGNEQICQMLLNNDKIDMNIKMDEKTPLYEACKYGNVGVAELLIKKGAKADCLTKNGKTPLHVACQHGFYKVVSLLLNCPEVDVNLLTVASPRQIQNRFYKTFYSPLHIACMNKNSYSRRRRPMPTHQFGFHHGPIYNDNNNDDYDYEFNREKLALGNHQLCVELLVYNKNTNINLRTSKGETALTIACQNQKFDIIKTLLQSPQIDPNVSGSYNSTALKLACQRGNINLVQMLLNNPKTNVNLGDSNDQTPLSTACDQNRIDIVQLLLNREDLKICRKNQENPIKKAIKNNNEELFNILVHHPSFDVNFEDKFSVTPLGYAIESQNINFINQLLLMPEIDVNKKSRTDYLSLNRGRSFYGNNKDRGETFQTPLSMALQLNNYQIIKMLIQYKYLDINEYTCGKTALHSSIINNNIKITTLLLSSSKIDPNLITVFDPKSIYLLDRYQTSSQKNDPYLCGFSSLHIACQKHDLDSVKELIKHYDLLVNEYTNAADISFLYDLKMKLYQSFIAKYTRFGKPPRIEETSLSVSFENKYRNGCNALYIACAENQPEIVSELLSRDDIDLNATSTNDKLTPLHIAAKSGFTDVVNILLSDKRCDPNATSKDGTNILSFACQSHNLDLLRMIMSEFGYLINSTSINGDNLLHYACRSNDISIFKVLLETADKSTFDINDKNLNGETLLHIAVLFEVPENLYRRKRSKMLFKSTNDNDKEEDDYEYIDDYKTKSILGLLISHGADINVVNNKNETPLLLACMHNLYNNINILLNQPQIKYDNLGSKSPFTTLISNAVSTNYKNNNMIIPNGLIETVYNFLNKGINYNNFDERTGLPLLHFGIICKSKQLVNFFFNNSDKEDIKTFLNYQYKYETPIQIAINNWNKDVMNILLRWKKDIKFTQEIKNEIVYKCVINNDEKSLLILLSRNKDEENDDDLDFDVNYINNEKDTPLQAAVRVNNSIATSILANNDQIDLSILDKSGKSALHNACMGQTSYSSYRSFRSINNDNSNNTNSQFTALAILTKVDFQEIQKMYDDDPDFTCSKFNKYLLTQLNSLNHKVDINIETKGMTKNEFFRRERQKVLALHPNTTRFHIWYHEPEFNIGFTPLHISVYNQQVNVVKKILLFDSLDFNAVSSHGDTALTMAAKNWNETIVKLLMDYPDANFNLVPKEPESDDEFDDYGNIKDKNEVKKVDPTRPDHTFTSEELYEIKQKKKNQKRTLLHAACQNNSLGIVKRLIKMSEDGIFDINGVDSFDEMAPLHYICENGNEEIFKLFIEFEKNHPNIIDWNIRNKNGMTPLHFAARGKQANIVNELINNEIVCPHVDINAVATGEFENGRTAISFACEKGLIDIVKLLLNDKDEEEENDPFGLDLNQEKKKVKRGSLCGAKSECDLTIKSKGAHQKGMTALHYACKSSNVEVVRLILNHGGFDINARANGKSCLFLACKHNRIEIVQLLLQQNDINYNIKTPRGVTPLMIASHEGRAKIVEMLLKQRRIDKNALTAGGESAKDMAKNSTIVELFEKYA